MKINRSLRKMIAMGLTVTMFGLPLTGCGNNNASSSGIFGNLFGSKDFSDGYAISHTHTSIKRLMVEEAFGRSVRQYIMARVLTERVARLDEKTVSKAEAVKMVNDAANAWDCLSDMLDRTERMATLLEKQEKQKQIALLIENSLFSHAYAAGKVTAKEDSVEWAKQIQAAYDSFPVGQKLKELTKELGASNPKEAHEKLEKAGKILDKESNWDVAKSTAKGLGKGAAVVAGIAVVAAAPVGVIGAAGALTSLSASGTAAGTVVGLGAFTVGMVATVSGTVAAGVHLGEDASGKKLEGDAAKFRDTVDNISLASGAANVLVTGGMSAVNAVKNATEGTTKAEIVKETVKGYLGNSRPEIAYNAYGAYDAGKGVTEKSLGIIMEKDDKGNAVVKPVEIPEDTPAAEVKPIENLTDEELSIATANYEKDGTNEEKTERMKTLEEMQKQPESKDDWVHWNANGINKAEYERILKDEPNDVRDHVQERYDDYKNSNEYKEELKKREETSKESGEVSGDAVKGEESGNVSGKEDNDKKNDSGKEATDDGAADAPYAIPKVIGASYSKSWSVEGETISVRYTVISQGDWIAISCVTSHAGTFTAEVTSYDPQTGVGVGVANGESGTFHIVGEPGSMTLQFNE